MKSYNLFAELKKNIEDFENGRILLTKKQFNDESARFLSKNNKGISYSQYETVNMIDLMINSVYKSGLYDSEGQRKTFLNIVRFIRDVSRMRTDIDVKNYIFKPDTRDDIWQAYFMSRQFKIWAREKNYSETLNRLQDDFCTYGTAVSKKVGSDIVRVPISSLRNKQDAESLDKTAKSNGYVIEEYDMVLSEMKEFKDWNIEGLDYSKTYKVFERYSLVPKWIIDKWNGEDTKNEEMVLAMQILLPDATDTKEEWGGRVLFLEKIDKVPYEEVWWERVNGRWLGRGPVENQFENQIARNMTANLRRRALLWGSKKVFQASGEDVPKNLIRDVKDGQVLQVGPNGQITQIPMESRNLAEFGSDESVWDKNSQQLSFTFEVTTGESLPSGTPFRLGVLLNQAVETFFSLKREHFGLWARRAFFSQLIPIFKKESKRHTVIIAKGEDGFESLKKRFIEFHTGDRFIKNILNGKIISIEDIRTQVEKEVNDSPILITEIEDNFYKDAVLHMDLDITGESEDTQEVIQTLTTIYQILSQKNDPRADNVLDVILSKTGKNMQSIAGKSQGGPMVPTAQQLSNIPLEKLQGMTTPNA